MIILKKDKSQVNYNYIYNKLDIYVCKFVRIYTHIICNSIYIFYDFNYNHIIANI